MPENSSSSCQILSLHSPAGSDVAIYKWPLHVTETWNEAHEIAETVRWACSDFPELETAMENCILSHFDPSSYESMKLFCEKYNRAVDNIRKLWSGRQPPACIDVPPIEHHLKHILTQVYNRSIKRPEELNQYPPFSPEVYGETSFELIKEVISITGLNENDIFLDLGSGVGQVVLQVAAAVGCKCYGIEKADIPANYAELMDEEFIKWMDFYGKSYGEYELIRGDFLDPKFDDIINSATVIFCNNFAFGPGLDLNLKQKFSNLRDGVKIVSSREFCPLNFRITERSLSDIGAIMRITPLKGSVSWTGNEVTFFLHWIDRTQLEEFFHRQKHMGEKYDGSTTTLSDEDDDSQSTTSTSSSSSSSSEDSSLDSNNEDDLFCRSKSELYHFPPSSSTTTTSLYPSMTHSAKPHSHATPTQPPRRKSMTSTSSVTKKSTPPLGSTHLPHPPHPHVQAFQSHNNKKSFPLATSSRRRGGGAGGRSQSTQRNQVKKTLIDKNSLTTLFDSFQKQNEAYLQQLNSTHFQTWLTDAAEKEKMKRKHLRGVIDHLETEVASLSQETIQSMQKSMLSLGITNLTPEGLLSGAKDIVSLNRQLRKEVQLLEREVGQLKEQHKEAMITIGQPNEERKQTTVKKETHETPPISLTPPTTTSHMHSTELHTNTSSSITNNNSAQSLTTPPTNEPTTPTINKEDPKMTTTCRIIVEDSTKACVRIPELALASSLYEITLESIDQAVLELGPFAKDAQHKERLESIVPLEGAGPMVGVAIINQTNNNVAVNKKESLGQSQCSYSPALKSDIPLSSLTTTKGTSKKSGRRRKEETPPTWSSATPPRPSSLNSPLLAEVTTPNNIVSEALPTHSEATVAEAMLALSQPPTHTTNEDINKGALLSSHGGSTSQINKEITTPTTSTTKSVVEEVNHAHQKVKSYAPPTYSYPLPPLSKLPPTTESVRQRTNSTSSVRSTKEDHPISSPSVYMQYDNRGVSHIRATPTTTTPTSTNPFLPPSLQQQADTSTASLVSFQYPFGWNPSALYRHNFYPTLSYPTHASVDSTHSIDPSLRQVIPPYLLRYPTYASGSLTALPGLVTSSANSLQAVNIGGGGTNAHLSAFKSLHGNYNRSLTPPTLHPLATAQTIDKTTPTIGGDTLAQWPFIGQYQPSGGVAFSPYATAVFPQGVSGGPQLAAYGSLTNATPLLQATPTQEVMRSDEGKKSKRDVPTSSNHDTLYRFSTNEQTDVNHPSIIGRNMGVATPPRPSSRSGRGGTKSDIKTTPKIKIHQMNNEDFQEKGIDRRRKRTQKGKELTLPPQAPIVMSSLPIQRGVVTHQEDDTIDVTSIDPVPHPLLIDNSAPSNHIPTTSNAINNRGNVPLISSVINSDKREEEEEEEEIEIDVDKMSSSEGTVSASSSPQAPLISPPPPLPLSFKIPPPSTTSSNSLFNSLSSHNHTPATLSHSLSNSHSNSNTSIMASPTISSHSFSSHSVTGTSLISTPLSSTHYSSSQIPLSIATTYHHITTATTANTSIPAINSISKAISSTPPAAINYTTQPITAATIATANAGTVNTSTADIKERDTTTSERQSNVSGAQVNSKDDTPSPLSPTYKDTTIRKQEREKTSITPPFRASSKTPPTTMPTNDSATVKPLMSTGAETPPITPPTFRRSTCHSTSSELVIDIGSPLATETTPTTLIEEGEYEEEEEENKSSDERVNEMTNQITDDFEPIIDISDISQTEFYEEEEEEEKDNILSPRATSIDDHTSLTTDHTPLLSPVEQQQSWSEFQDQLNERVFSSSFPSSLRFNNDSKSIHHTDNHIPVTSNNDRRSDSINNQLTVGMVTSNNDYHHHSRSTKSPLSPLLPPSSLSLNPTTTITSGTRTDTSISNSLSMISTDITTSSFTSSNSGSSSHHKKKSHKHHHKSSKHRHSTKEQHSLSTKDPTTAMMKPYKSLPNHMTPPTHHTHDKLTTHPSRYDTQEGHRSYNERKSHKSTTSHKHRSPRPHPYSPPTNDELLSPTRHAHLHHRKRHTPTNEDRHYNKKLNHTPQYYESGRGQHRSHSSTPVHDIIPEVTSGRGSDKSHTHHTRDTISPNWSSDDPERREWSHHHGDRSDRKRRGSEGCDEYKYKMIKHKHITTSTSNSSSTNIHHRKHHHTTAGTKGDESSLHHR